MHERLAYARVVARVCRWPPPSPVHLNGERKVIGVLRGYDPFMNIVLDDAVEVVSSTERNALGMIVRACGARGRGRMLPRPC